LPNQPISAKIS